MESVVLALLLFGIAWTVIFGFIHYRTVARAKAAEGWPTSAGRILSSEVLEEESEDREGGTTTWYNPVVTYSYSAGGRELRGKRLRFGNVRRARRNKAEAALSAYPVGAAVPVRYDPERPEECVLETAKPGPLYLIMAAFGVVFAAFALYLNSLT